MHTLIYSNGDSYSDPGYADELATGTYAHHLADRLNGYAMNRSLSGSCNRRIIRSTVHDILEQRRINPEQPIIALLGFSFDLRSELWLEKTDPLIDRPEESNFRSMQFTTSPTWHEDLLKGKDIGSESRFDFPDKFFKKYNEGRAFFFSPHAERINLITDIIMLRELLTSLDIRFLMFQHPAQKPLESGEYLLDTFSKFLYNDKRILDLNEFSFCNWCHSQKFQPLDCEDRPWIGHYGTDAHHAFAEKVLLPLLEETR